MQQKKRVPRVAKRVSTGSVRKLNRKPFYLDEIRPYQSTRFKWSDKDKELLLHMRVKQGLTVKEIQSKLKEINNIPEGSDVLGITAIHNQIRIGRAQANSLCYHCREPLTRKEKIYNTKHKRSTKICFKCFNGTSDYKRSRRLSNIKKGYCGLCGEKPKLNGYTYCSSCLSYTYRHRISNGICGVCGRAPIHKKRSASMCKNCLGVNKERAQYYNERSKSLKGA